MATQNNPVTPSSDFKNRVDAGDLADIYDSLLRGELSAVETYRQAIEKLQDSPKFSQGITLLQQLKSSHERRVGLLRAQVQQCGGEPSKDSGAWGMFAKLVEGAAELFGAKSAIAALEEGEDHGLTEYEQNMKKLDAAGRSWIESNIYPEQKRTHDALRDFKRQMQAS